ncbi:UNVERIFIED_ORG: hypothetical protein EC838_3468 [Providencia alcalifaciens]
MAEMKLKSQMDIRVNDRTGDENSEGWLGYSYNRRSYPLYKWLQS